jgi:YggT family protein
MLNPFLDLVLSAIHIYGEIVVVYIIFSWLGGLGILNTGGRFFQFCYGALGSIVQPSLNLIRRILPFVATSFVDFSPIVLFLALRFISNIIVYYFA